MVNKIYEDPTGLDVITVKNVETGKYTVVYQGTNAGKENGMQDILTDAQMAGPLTPEQVKAARKYYDQMKAKYGDKLTSVCGNSLGGGLANAVAVEHPDVKAVTINPSILPEGEVDRDQDYPNITNYFSKYDPLTLAEEGVLLGDRIPGKVIEIDNGVPFLSALMSNHMGYRMGENTEEDQSVEIGEKGKPGYGRIYISAGDHIVTSIWTGEPLYGNIGSNKIEINKENLDLLAAALENDVLRRLGYVSEYLQHSNEIVENEKKLKSKRLADLREMFTDMFESAFGDPLFIGISQAGNILKYLIDGLIALLDTAEEKCRSLNVLLNSPPSELLEYVFQTNISVESITGEIRGYLNGLKHDIDILTGALTNMIRQEISDVFVNPAMGFADAVADEIYSHFVIVGKNEKGLKKQVKTFIRQVQSAGEGIQTSDRGAAQDIKNRKAPTQQKTSVPASVQSRFEESDYLKDRLKLKDRHVNSSVATMAGSINASLVPVANILFDTLLALELALETSAASIKGTGNLFLGLAVPAKLFGMFSDWDEKIKSAIDHVVKPLGEIAETIEGVRKAVGNLISFLPCFVYKFKPYIDNAIFEQIHFNSVNLYNTAAVSILEETELLFQDIVFQLSNQKAKAITALCNASKDILKNIKLLRADVKRGTL
ncbi:SA1320 family protein [Bacillus sp. FSL M8-0168]|uniref:SA1320 family protein n=2 Tax=Bacillus TaxID=1386 RepID=UPI0030FD5A7E